MSVSGGSLAPLAFAESDADGKYGFKVKADEIKDFDTLFVAVKGPGSTSFHTLLTQKELAASPLDLQLEPQRVDITPLTPGDASGFVFRAGLMRSLPLPGDRDIDNLVLLAPGVFPPPEAAALSGPGIAPGVGTAGRFSVNGLRSRQNNFILDGADNTDEGTGVDRRGFVFLAPLPAEAVAEIQAITGSADARFGRGAGAHINVLSSSGSGSVHGSAYGYVTDRRLNAQDFFDNRAGRQDSPFTRVQAGLTASGPLAAPRVHDPRTFFFAMFEDQATHAARETSFSVPTVAQRGYLNRGATGIVLADGSSLYPSSLTGNAIFSLYPFPNNPAGPFGPNTYTAALPANADGHLYSLKLDRYLRAFGVNNVLTTRYSQTGEHSDLPAVDQALFASVGARLRTRSVSSFFNSTWVTHWSNTVRFGWGHSLYEFDQRLSPLQLSSALFPAQPFLLNRPLLLNVSTPGTGPAFVSGAAPNTQTEQITGPVSRVNVAGFSPVGIDSSHFLPRRSSDTFQVADTVTRVTGRNSLSLGAEMWRLHLTTTSLTAPEITFYGQILKALPPIFEGAPPPAATGRLDVASVVAAGLVPSFQQAARQNPPLGLHRGQFDFFFQDDFRVSSRLTVNVGGRFILQRLPQANDGRFDRPVDPALFNKSVCNTMNGLPSDSCSTEIDRLAKAFPAGFQKSFNAQSFHSDVRAGFAWNLFGNTPLRFGFGTYTSQLPAAIVDQTMLIVDPPVPPCNCGIHAGVAGLTSGSALNPLIPDVRSAALANPAPGLRVVQPAPNLGTPSSLQYNFGFERRLPGGDVVSVAYVGTVGRNLLRVREQNAAAGPGFAILAIQRLTGNNPDFFSTRVPAIGAGNVSKLLFETSAQSRFDSLQFEFRGSAGPSLRFGTLQFGTAFTWARSTDDASDFFDTAGSFALPQNNDHPSEHGPSSFDARLRGTGYFVWDLPHPKKWSALRGWQLDGIVTAQTGQPFTVNTVFDINGDGLLTDRLATTTGLVGPAVGRSISGAGRTTLLALAPGVSPANLLATPPSDGAVGRNSFRAGGMASIDLALSKTFAFRERYKLAWRVESFNSANRSNFGVPVRILEAPAFGQAFRTVTPNRKLQIGGTFDF